MQTIATPKSVREFGHRPLPKRFFNFERLMDTMKTRNIDVIVASGIYNVFYLTGYNSVSQRVDEPRPIAVVISRHEPDHPIIVIADCCLSHFLYQPTWVEDFRPFQSSLVPIGYPVDPNVFDQMMPKEGLEKEWVKRAREHYAPNMVQATKKAIRSLMPQNGRIAFDDLRFANRILEPGQELVDAYGPLMYVREVKTPQEIHLLKEATRLNQTAIETAIAAWEPGMTWHQLGHLYHKLCIDMGGFIRDPGAAAVANPRGTDPALTLASGLDPDFVLEKGTNVMLDCHGSLDLYCWDGGKTWVAGDGPSGLAQRIGKAAADTMLEIEKAMRPGTTISQLQAIGHKAFNQHNIPNSESIWLFFHCIGLSHWDLDLPVSDTGNHPDWALEKGMVIAGHVFYPGDDRHRLWLEDISIVGDHGSESIFTWDMDMLYSK